MQCPLCSYNTPTLIALGRHFGIKHKSRLFEYVRENPARARELEINYKEPPIGVAKQKQKQKPFGGLSFKKMDELERISMDNLCVFYKNELSKMHTKQNAPDIPRTAMKKLKIHAYIQKDGMKFLLSPHAIGLLEVTQ